jgi:hypothetical protein
MAEENKPRVYGMADQANRHPPPAQGMRGEQAAPGLRARDPEFAHMVTLENGKRVPVSEGNGVAYAEAIGRVARPEDRELEIEFVPEEQEKQAVVATSQRRSGKPLLIGAMAAGVAAGLYLMERFRLSAESPTLGAAPRPQTGQSETALVPVQPVHETGPLVPVQQLPHQQSDRVGVSVAAS